MAALINTIQINYYKQQCQRTLRTKQVCAYSEVRSVVSQPKCHQIDLFSWILDDGRAPATGIRRVNLEPTDENISPVSVRSVLFKVAGYPGNFSRRIGVRCLCGPSAHRRRWRRRRGSGREPSPPPPLPPLLPLPAPLVALLPPAGTPAADPHLVTAALTTLRSVAVVDAACAALKTPIPAVAALRAPPRSVTVTLAVGVSSTMTMLARRCTPSVSGRISVSRKMPM